MTASDTHQVIDAVWRIESPRLIAGLTRIVRDIGVAEDLAHDALVAALQQWPESGIPGNPGAWLMGAAKHRAIDHLRRRQMLERKHDELAYETEAASAAPDPAEALDTEVSDDLLRLIFTACHPVLPREARVALTLRLIGGLTTDEIARGFLSAEPTIAQRIVRAKKTLAAKKVPFDVPDGPARAERLSSVLEVIYLIFNEGYTATAGDRWIRNELCEDAVRVARILAGLMPDEPEVFGLTALLEIQASRFRARVSASGEVILLTDQNRALWDQMLIRRGLAALARADELGGRHGPYALQAAIAACHAQARTMDETDWPRIVSLYDELMSVTPSPVVALNRAVAVGMAFGPDAALVAVDGLAGEPSLQSYPWLFSVRGDLLEKLGRRAEAREAFAHAASLTRNERDRELLLKRAAP